MNGVVCHRQSHRQEKQCAHLGSRVRTVLRNLTLELELCVIKCDMRDLRRSKGLAEFLRHSVLENEA